MLALACCIEPIDCDWAASAAVSGGLLSVDLLSAVWRMSFGASVD